jgi:hypothetical protein
LDSSAMISSIFLLLVKSGVVECKTLNSRSIMYSLDWRECPIFCGFMAVFAIAKGHYGGSFGDKYTHN